MDDRQMFNTFRVCEAAANGNAPVEIYNGHDGAKALEDFREALARDGWEVKLEGWGGARTGWKLMRLYKRYR